MNSIKNKSTNNEELSSRKNSMNHHKNKKMESERFPSSIQEGWIRTKFCLMAIYNCGDGVVKVKSGWLFSTTSPKSMKLTDFSGYFTESHGFGYSSCPDCYRGGGEFYGLQMKNELNKKI
jgi:hypothetical protein